MHHYFLTKFSFLFIALSLCFSSVSFAENVRLKLKHNYLTALADYKTGNSEQPAVLLLHGFLATNQFQTIQSLSQVLNDEGYTTLAPNLSLNIDQRAETMKCDDLHTHTLASDNAELQEWITWLKSKGHKKIVLLGHSTGSALLLNLIHKLPEQSVDLAILTSLFYIQGEELNIPNSLIEFAQSSAHKTPSKADLFSMAYCKDNYLALPNSFLSYMTLNRNTVLNQLKEAPVPTYTIMAEADQRYSLTGKTWVNEIQQTGSELILIQGANHFFSGLHEYDLHEKVIHLLKRRYPT